MTGILLFINFLASMVSCHEEGNRMLRGLDLGSV